MRGPRGLPQMLQLFYVCYFAAFGVSIPFFAPYLWGLGLSGREIALMMSVAPCFHLGVPLLWGWVADRIRRPDRMLRIACIGACLGLAPMVLVRRMPEMLLVYAIHQLSAVAIIGLTDSLAIAQARRTGVDYTRLRLWGSASFVFACWVMGPVLAARGQVGGDPLVPLVITGAYALAALAVLRHPQRLARRGRTGRAPPARRGPAARATPGCACCW